MMNRKAFTLLEMSLTILLLSIVLVGGINFQLSLIDSSHKNITEMRLKKIQIAIDNYFMVNGRLPCPASLLTTDTASNFGTELRTSTACSYASSSYLSNNIIYGGVPVRVLELPDEYGFDGWGNRIIYAMDRNYGTKILFLQSGGDSITIKNLKNKVITNKAIYVLFSSGENRNGAFKNGKQLTVNSTLQDYENVYRSGFNKIFIKDLKTENFDDMLFYREKKDILISTDGEDTPCNLKDLGIIDTDYSYTSYSLCKDNICQHGIEIPSKLDCPNGKISKNPDRANSFRPIRRCLKYGEWSNIMYECEPGCNQVANLPDLKTGNITASGQLMSILNYPFAFRTADGEEIVLECTGEYMGYVTLRCNAGMWEYVGGDCYHAQDRV